MSGTRVEAYEDDDGKLHKSEKDCALRNAEIRLIALYVSSDTTRIGTSEGFLSYMLNAGVRIHAALDPIIQVGKGPVLRG